MFADDSRVHGDGNHTEVTIRKTVYSMFRTYHNGGRARWLAWTLAGCVLAVEPLIADRSWAHEFDVVDECEDAHRGIPDADAALEFALERRRSGNWAHAASTPSATADTNRVGLCQLIGGLPAPAGQRPADRRVAGNLARQRPSCGR
jgi:hypothetical protein